MQVGRQAHQVLDADLLVPAGGGKQDVRVAGRLAHAEAHVHDEPRLGEERVAHPLARRAVAKYVAAHAEDDLRRLGTRRRGHRPAALLERLVEVAARRPRQPRVAVLGREPKLV